MEETKSRQRLGRRCFGDECRREEHLDNLEVKSIPENIVSHLKPAVLLACTLAPVGPSYPDLVEP